jgi:nitrous oxidase accessory protein NosD
MNRSILLSCVLACALVLASLVPRAAHATQGKDACTGFIKAPQDDSWPVRIGTPGVWCLEEDLASDFDAPTGAPVYGVFEMITVDTADVTIDCRGHRLSYTGVADFAHGIMITDAGAMRAVVRNCRLDGFSEGIFSFGYEYDGFQVLIEDNVLTGNRRGLYGSVVAIHSSANAIIRRNRIYGAVDNGIIAYYHASVVDNLIDGLVDTASSIPASAIYMSQSWAAEVRGNTIRGLRHDPALVNPPPMTGIYLRTTYPGNVRLAIRDNTFAGDGATPAIGIDCTEVPVRFTDNVIAGFSAPNVNCIDGGDNDVSP